MRVSHIAEGADVKTELPAGPICRCLAGHMLILITLAGALFLALAGGRPLRADGQSQQALYLRLRYATFDPLQDPPVRAAGDLVPSPQSGRHPYIVQFTGPMNNAWREGITAGGAAVLEYIPDYAFVVSTSPGDAARLRSLPFVRWVGYVQPVYRIDPSLLTAQGSPTVTVTLFPGSTTSSAISAVQRNGGVLLSSADDPQTSALRASLSVGGIRALAADPTVAWIEPYRPPRLWNDQAGSIMQVSPVWTSHNLRGSGQIIAIADTGLDVGRLSTLNSDFRGRVVAAHALGRLGDWSDPDGHGTHVAGSALGSGANSGSNPATGDYSNSFAGIAPAAQLVVQSLLDRDGHLGGIPADLTALLQQAYDDGARVHSNSWGVSVADGGRVYDSQAQQVDRFVWEHPDMVVLFAAGNDGVDRNRDGVVDLGSVTTPATAKNVMSVGASESVRSFGGYNPGGLCSTWGGCWPDLFPTQPLHDDRLSNNVNGIAAFSSRGPTPDGRIKPDLVAPGTNIISVRSALAPSSHYWGVYDDYYAYGGGTSMSTPLVAGASALVRQYYQANGHNPSAALVKATLLAGAVDMTPGQYNGQVEVAAAPNNVEGWGRVDVTNALFPVSPRQVDFIDASDGVTTDQTVVYTYTVASSAVPLRIVLAWTDYPGSLMAATNLVNDLDLQVALPVSSTTGSAGQIDHLNNVEGVIVNAPPPGVYQITVRGRNVPFGPQPYALVVSGDLLQEAATPAVRMTPLRGFVTSGSTITVTWTISGGTVVTATSLLWDMQSRTDHQYAFSRTLPISTSRQYTSTIVVPDSGMLYVSASAWVDGRLYYAWPEQRINVVTREDRIWLPIIMTYPAPDPTPTPLPTITPPTAVQLIRNGGFEDAAPQSPPWRQYDRAGSDVLVSDFWPRNGMWSAWMGGVYSDYQQLYQAVTIPPCMTYASLLFHWYMNSEDSLTEAHDVLVVRLLNADGDPLMTVLQRDNTSTRNTWMATYYSWIGDFPYAGQTIRVSFEMVTDESHNTNLFVDDVSFFVSSGPIDGSEAGSVEYAER